jgi:ribosomal protein L11 methyltransferase
LRSRPKKWLVAEYWATKDTAEVAQSAFLESGAIGIEVDDGLGPEGQIKYPDNTILLKAYFERFEKDLIESSLNNFLKECQMPMSKINFLVLDEEDWQGNFVRSCTTFVVEPEIYIVPSFEINKFDKNKKLYIEMDPENAFGTGQHQTTKLCLKSIHEYFSTKKDLVTALDVGTGSGILAILIKKLGALTVLATEVDEDALITAQKNALKNQVLIETLAVKEDHKYESSKYDLIVANILAPVLILMAENLSKSLKPHGEIILSGILLEQALKVKTAYEQCGLKFKKELHMDDWCALIFSN